MTRLQSFSTEQDFRQTAWQQRNSNLPTFQLIELRELRRCMWALRDDVT